jgi:hypothetical protein
MGGANLPLYFLDNPSAYYAPPARERSRRPPDEVRVIEDVQSALTVGFGPERDLKFFVIVLLAEPTSCELVYLPCGNVGTRTKPILATFSHVNSKNDHLAWGRVRNETFGRVQSRKRRTTF